MYKIFIFLFFGFTIWCNAETMNFTFYGTNDRGHYNSTTVSTDMQREYGPAIQVHAIILVESDSNENTLFQEENKILDNLPHGTMEELATIIVTSLTDRTYQHGYHTSIDTAKQLAKERPEYFRITILSQKGVVLKQSISPMSAKAIIEVITNYSPK